MARVGRVEVRLSAGDDLVQRIQRLRTTEVTRLTLALFRAFVSVYRHAVDDDAGESIETVAWFLDLQRLPAGVGIGCGTGGA